MHAAHPMLQKANIFIQFLHWDSPLDLCRRGLVQTPNPMGPMGPWGALISRVTCAYKRRGDRHPFNAVSTSMGTGIAIIPAL